MSIAFPTHIWILCPNLCAFGGIELVNSLALTPAVLNNSTALVCQVCSSPLSTIGADLTGLTIAGDVEIGGEMGVVTDLAFGSETMTGLGGTIGLGVGISIGWGLGIAPTGAGIATGVGVGVEMGFSVTITGAGVGDGKGLG